MINVRQDDWQVGSVYLMLNDVVAHRHTAKVPFIAHNEISNHAWFDLSVRVCVSIA